MEPTATAAALAADGKGTAAPGASAALAASGKGTAAHDASVDAVALLGVEASMKQAQEEPSGEEDAAGQKPVLSKEGKKPVPSAEEKKPVPFAEEKKPVPSDDEKKPVPSEEGKKPVPFAEEKKPVPFAEEKKPVPSDEEKEPVLSEKGKKPAPSEDAAGKVSVCEKAAPSEIPVVGKEEKVRTEEEKTPSEQPAGEDRKGADLPVDMVLAVAARLPSKDAGRSAVLSKAYRYCLGEPVFLKTHLVAAPSRFFIEDTVPNTVVLQPAREQGLRQGYTHLTIINMRQRGNLIYDMPVRAGYDYDDHHHYCEYAITNVDGHGLHQVRTPPPFFHKTVPDLDLALLASEGRLLVAHSPKHGLFVCNPTEDRFVHLPDPLINIDSRQTTAALRYKLGSWGEIDDFDVVLLSPLPSGHVALQRFSTGGGGWVLTDIGEDALVAVLAGVSAPGIYASDAFYWIDDHTGSLIQYGLDDRHLSAVAPPPVTDGYPSRQGWSLGSTGGLPRLSSFSLAAEDHAVAGMHANINGVLSVWIKNESGWVLVKELLVPVSRFLSQYGGMELPFDVAKANGHRLMVRKDKVVLTRDLGTNENEFVSNLYLRDDTRLNQMYSNFKSFSV